QQRRIRALQFGNGILGNRIRGIAVARVVAVGRRGAHLLLHVGDFEGRSLIDRRGEWTVLFGEAGAAAYRLGFLTELVLLHFKSPVETRLAASLHENASFIPSPHSTPARAPTTPLTSHAGRSPVCRTPVARRGLRAQPYRHRSCEN